MRTCWRLCDWLSSGGIRRDICRHPFPRGNYASQVVGAQGGGYGVYLGFSFSFFRYFTILPSDLTHIGSIALCGLYIIIIIVTFVFIVKLVNSLIYCYENV